MRNLTRAMILQLLGIAPIIVLGSFSLVFGGVGLLGATEERNAIPIALGLVATALCVACLVAAIIAQPDAVRSRRAFYGFVFAGLVLGCVLAAILLFLYLKRDAVGTLLLYGVPLAIGTFQCFRIGTSLSRANKLLKSRRAKTHAA